MRIAKSYKYLPLIYLPIVFALLYSEFHFASKHVLLPYQIIGWVGVALAIICLILPYGKTVLDVESEPGKRYRPLRWFSMIALLQISLTLTFSGIYQTCFKLLPLDIEPYSLSHSFQLLWQHWGLFPWGIIAVFASYLAFIGYNNKSNAFLSTSLVPLFKNKDTSIITHISQVSTRNLVVLTTAATFSLYIVLLSVLFVHGNRQVIPHGMQQATYLSVITMLLLAFLPFVKNGIKKLLKQSIPTIIGLCSLLCISALVLIFIGTLFGSASSMIGNTSPQSGPLPLQNLLSQIGKNDIWLLFSANWWLGFIPISAVLIAYYSKGYRANQVLAATLILPACAALCFWLLPHCTEYFNHITPGWQICLALLGFATLYALATTRTSRAMFILSYLPKRGRRKNRDHHFFFRRIFRYSIMMLYLYLPAGLVYLAVILVMLGSAFYLVLLCMLAGFVTSLIKGKVR